MKKLVLIMLAGLLCINLFGQNKIITGTVLDENGTPIPGANVYIKNTTQGSVTNLAGEYSIEVQNANDAILVFSVIGYLSEEVPINGRSEIDMNMSPSLESLDEVVIIGYGQNRKDDLTTSVSTVSGKDISRSPVASVDNALQGNVSGVQISSSSGKPGAEPDIRIRGIGSFNYNEPLYVIDGVIISQNDIANQQKTGNALNSGGLGYVNAAESPNLLATLNPNDIESISVLKDASATAIYGSRGGNGVIIITTKQGEKGKAKVNYNFSVGIQDIVKKIDVLNARQYAEFSNDARRAAGLTVNPAWSNFEVANGQLLYIDSTAWLGEGTFYQDEVLRKAKTTSHQLSISGGNEKNKYYTSFGIMDNEGILLNSGFKRYSFRLNLDSKLNEWLNMSNRYSFSNIEKSGNSSSGPFFDALRRSPTIPVYTFTPSGAKVYAGPSSIESSSYAGPIGNPVRSLLEPTYNDNTQRMLGNTNLTADFLKIFQFKSSFGTDYSYTTINRFSPSYTEYPVDSAATPGLVQNTRSASKRVFIRRGYLWENTLSFKFSINNNNFSGVFGTSTQQTKTDLTSATSTGHRTNELTTVAAGPDGATGTGSRVYKRYFSLLGRIQYDYNRIAYASGSLRRDGSSVFGINNKYEIFPAVSGALRISSLSFMQPTENIISDLKIRGSWGRNGVDGGIGVSPQFAELNESYHYILNGQVVTGTSLGPLQNEGLKWEVNEQIDLGIDLAFLQNKISLTFDYFERNTEGVIISTNVPLVGGHMPSTNVSQPKSVLINGASIHNNGIEIDLGIRNYGGALTYDINLNISKYNNNITSVYGNEIIPLNNQYTLYRKDQSIGEFYGYSTNGVIKDSTALGLQNGSGLGDLEYQDVARIDSFGHQEYIPDDTITVADQLYLGSPIPDFTMGLNVNLSYRAFDFSCSFYGSYGNEIYNANFETLLGSADGGNKSIEMLDRYHTINNPNGSMPRAHSKDPGNNDRKSDFFVEDGSYLRLQNIELAYNLPAHILNTLHISNLRVYVSSQNLFTITNYRGVSPDVPANGVDAQLYPQAKTFMLGINIGL